MLSITNRCRAGFQFAPHRDGEAIRNILFGDVPILWAFVDQERDDQRSGDDERRTDEDDWGGSFWGVNPLRAIAKSFDYRRW